MKRFWDFFTAALLLVGATLIVAGCWIVHPAIGLVIGGGCFITIALVMVRGDANG